MPHIPIAFCGAGKMALAVAKQLIEHGGKHGLALAPFGWCGGAPRDWPIDDHHNVRLQGPLTDSSVGDAARQFPHMIVLDMTAPAVGTSNAVLLASARVPFVSATSGVDAAAVRSAVTAAGGVGVIAPNLAPPLVAIMAAMQWAAESFPGVLDGFEFGVHESHQAAKKDISGTARALLPTFSKLLGRTVADDAISSIRDPEIQRDMGVPDEHLAGHALHHYGAANADGTLSLVIEHNVLGREPYASGALVVLQRLARIAARHEVKSGTGRCMSVVELLKINERE